MDRTTGQLIGISKNARIRDICDTVHARGRESALPTLAAMYFSCRESLHNLKVGGIPGYGRHRSVGVVYECSYVCCVMYH